MPKNPTPRVEIGQGSLGVANLVVGDPLERIIGFQALALALVAALEGKDIEAVGDQLLTV
jgi:hypothetical protein